MLGVAVVKPLTGVVGIGPKLWSLMLAELLLVGDPGRERWVTAGAGMIAVDSLVHNFLHRTGSLRRCGADHHYGPACYAPGGCADILRRFAETIDARQSTRPFRRLPAIRSARHLAVLRGGRREHLQRPSD